jgi:septation ring formation regulator EzrA
MTLATKLRDSKAVCAGAGAVDLAVEKLREVPERVTKLQDTARENASKLQGTARENAAKLQENAAKLQENVKEFQGRVDAKDIPGAAVAYVTHLGTRVSEVIDELAERGKTVVTRFEPEVAEIEKPKPEPKTKAAQTKKGTQSTSGQTTTEKSGV